MNPNERFLCQNLLERFFFFFPLKFESFFWTKNDWLSKLMVKNKSTITSRTEWKINCKNQVNKKFIFGSKQAKSTYLNSNERFWCQNMWGQCFISNIIWVIILNKITSKSKINGIKSRVKQKLMVKTKSTVTFGIVIGRLCVKTFKYYVLGQIQSESSI